jgi:hypothetical protein
MSARLCIFTQLWWHRFPFHERTPVRTESKLTVFSQASIAHSFRNHSGGQQIEPVFPRTAS